MYDPREEHKILIGNNALTKQKIFLSQKDMACHWHVQGSTGRGKTKALETMARGVIDAGYGLVVIDAKGDLFDGIRDYIIQEGLQSRVEAIIDPEIQEFAVGLNYLEPQGGTLPDTHAAKVIDGLKRTFGEQEEFKPLLEKWGSATAQPLIRYGLTMAEIEKFASMSDPRLREAVFYFLKKVGSPVDRLMDRWKEAENLSKTEASMQVVVVQTRGALIANTDMGEAMFGQTKTTVNWKRVLDEGKIVLVKLKEGSRLDHRLAQIIGITVVHQLFETALDRPRDFRPHAWCFCDEFQEYACEDFSRSLVEMRSFHLWFVLSNQLREHLKKIPGLIETIDGNCDGRLYFSISNADAQEVVNDLFQGYIHGDHVKHIQEATKFEPVETTRTVRSEAHGETDSKSESFMEVDVHGNVEGMSSGATQVFGPDGLPSGYVDSHGSSSGDSSSRSEGRGSATGHSESHVIQETEAPWYEYRKFMEETGRQFYTIEEITNRCVKWITTQDPRRAQMKIVSMNKAIPIITAYVDPPVISEDEIPKFMNVVLGRCAKKLSDILPEIRKRVPEIIESYKTARKEDNEKKEQEELKKKAKDAEFQTQPGLLAPPGPPAWQPEPPPVFEPSRKKKKTT